MLSVEISGVCPFVILPTDVKSVMLLYNITTKVNHEIHAGYMAQIGLWSYYLTLWKVGVQNFLPLRIMGIDRSDGSHLYHPQLGVADRIHRTL
jgi:hypothetical protein